MTTQPIQLPQEHGKMSRVGRHPGEADWEMMLASWAVDWRLLSQGAQEALYAALPKVHNRIYSLEGFPGGRCNKYCELLATRLGREGIDVRVMKGLYSVEIKPGTPLEQVEEMIRSSQISEEGLDYGGHCWLEVEGVLVDPTASQFIGQRAFGGEMPYPGPWGLECYFAHWENQGPFPREWWDQGWQEVDVHYNPATWRRI